MHFAAIRLCAKHLTVPVSSSSGEHLTVDMCDKVAGGIRRRQFLAPAVFGQLWPSAGFEFDTLSPFCSLFQSATASSEHPCIVPVCVNLALGIFSVLYCACHIQFTTSPVRKHENMIYYRQAAQVYG